MGDKVSTGFEDNPSAICPVVTFFYKKDCKELPSNLSYKEIQLTENKKMRFEDKHFYHVYNRGNNKQQIFFKRKNYLFFLDKCRKHLLSNSSIVAYCLMPNHFHLLLYIHSKKTFKSTLQIKSNIHPLVQNISTLLSSYAQAINKQEGRSGSLFRSKTKAKCLNEGTGNYALTCFHYIHQNPVKAGLVKRFGNWPFSSYRDYAGIRNEPLPDIELGFKTFSFKHYEHFKECSKRSLDANGVKKIF